MKILGFEFSLKKAPRPVSAEYCTLAARVQLLEDRLGELEAFAREKGTRLETVYRKVYRDEEKARDNGEAGEVLVRPGVPKPGDPFR